jgi:response regulator of citrate/malate metabolism
MNVLIVEDDQSVLLRCKLQILKRFPLASITELSHYRQIVTKGIKVKAFDLCILDFIFAGDFDSAMTFKFFKKHDVPVILHSSNSYVQIIERLSKRKMTLPNNFQYCSKADDLMSKVANLHLEYA